MLARAMATRLDQRRARRFGARWGLALLLCLSPGPLHAEPWSIAFARRLTDMAYLNVREAKRPVSVRIGLLYDPRQTYGRESADDLLAGFRQFTLDASDDVWIRAELIAVDNPVPLAAAFASGRFQIVVLPAALGDAEWALALSLAARYKIGTVAAISDHVYEPTDIKRLGPATFVCLGVGERVSLYTDPDRVGVEGVFGAAALGNAPHVIRETAAPPPTAPAAPSAPASGVAP